MVADCQGGLLIGTKTGFKHLAKELQIINGGIALREDSSDLIAVESYEEVFTLVFLTTKPMI